MKKIIILTLFLSLKVSAQEIPSTTEIPHYSSTESDMILKGYSDAPKTTVTEKLYRPSFENRTSNYVKKLQETQEVGVQPDEGGTLEKIISESNNKIDINGGYVKANDAYTTEDDGTLKPKHDVYKPGVNNDEYNTAIQKQERKKDFKNVKNTAEELLPLILMFVLIIAAVYLIIYLRRKIRTNPF